MMDEGTSPAAFLNMTLVSEAWAHAELAMLVVDDDGHYVGTNESALKLTGYSHEELTRLRAGRDLAGDEPSARIYTDIALRNKLRGRKLVRRKDGGLVNCRYWGIRTTISRLPYFILLLRQVKTNS